MAAHKDGGSKPSTISTLLRDVAAQLTVNGYKQQQLQKPSDDLPATIKIDGAEENLRDILCGLAFDMQDQDEKGDKKDARHLKSNLQTALFGSFALVVPMLIMTLHQTKLTTLLTTSSFVLAVAVILAAAMTDAEPKDILTATAGYAAVLVVFVGTGGSKVAASLSEGAIAGIVIGVLAAALLVILVSVKRRPDLVIKGLKKVLALRHHDSDLLEEEDPETESASSGSAEGSPRESVKGGSGDTKAPTSRVVEV